MKTYHSLIEALPSLVTEAYHPLVAKEILFALYQLEQLLSCGETGSTVIVPESEQDLCIAEEHYHLRELVPELRERIEAGNETWLKTVYITDDAGNGIVCFQRVPLCTEK